MQDIKVNEELKLKEISTLNLKKKKWSEILTLNEYLHVCQSNILLYIFCDFSVHFGNFYYQLLEK